MDGEVKHMKKDHVAVIPGDVPTQEKRSPIGSSLMCFIRSEKILNMNYQARVLGPGVLHSQS